MGGGSQLQQRPPISSPRAQPSKQILMKCIFLFTASFTSYDYYIVDSATTHGTLPPSKPRKQAKGTSFHSNKMYFYNIKHCIKVIQGPRETRQSSHKTSHSNSNISKGIFQHIPSLIKINFFNLRSLYYHTIGIASISKETAKSKG